MDKIKQIGFKAGEKPRRPVIQADTSASKSYASIAYGISEGEIVGLVDGAKSIILDGTPVMSSSGDLNIPDVTIQERKGTNDQTHLEGFPAVVNEKQYNNIEMLFSTPFVHYINDTNLDAVGIRFTFGALQSTNPDNGDVSGTTIEYAVDVQVDGQGYQELLRTNIVGKYSAGYQRYHRVELPPAEEGWEVRIRRLTPNSTSTYIADKMYLDAVAEILDVKMRYPNTALIGLKFDSERFSNIPKVDFRMRGKIIRVPANYDPVTRTYAQAGEGTTNGIWNGQFKMAYTTNPAWIFYDLVLNKRYGLGNRIDPSMLDKWSLYSIAQYCDVMVPDGEGGLEPRFTCNVYINNRFEAYDCLMQLAGVFRGIMYWSGTAIIAGCDRPQDPVFTYTSANIIGEFNYSGTRTRDRHSVVMVSFDDPKNNYKTDKEVVSDRKAISEIGVRTKDLAAFACTSRGQAQRAGKWALFKEQLETRIVTFALGMDGYIAPVGRVIEIADPLLAGRAVGGRIAAVSSDKKTITLDRDTEVKVGDRLVLNNEEGEQESRQVSSVSGRNVTVTVAFDSPAVQHVWAVDSDDLQLMRFTVISVTENRSQDSINFTVTALQHEPALHEVADYSAYIERNNYSVIDITTQKAPAEVLISSNNRINQGIDITDLVISWKQAENAVKYHVQWRRDDGNWIQMPLQYGNQVTVENVYHGVYEARVVAINAADVNSLQTSSLPTPINSKFAAPAALASLSATGILLGVELNWKFPLYGAQNAAYVEIYWALNADKSDEQLLGSYAYPTTGTTLNGLAPHLTLYFRGRLVDRNGIASEFTQWVTATVDANPDKLIDIISGYISESTLDQVLRGKIDGASGLANDAQNLANQAKVAADNATAKAQEAADAVTQEAINRAAALQAGISQVTTDYIAADSVIYGELNAYKASNDSAVATVVQKAESAVATGMTNSQSITELTGQVQAINNTKLDASVISNYYTKGQTDAKADEIAAGKIESYAANLKVGGRNLWNPSETISAFESSGSYTHSNDAHRFLPTYLEVSGSKLLLQIWNPNRIINTVYSNRVAFYTEDKTHISSTGLNLLSGEPYQKQEFNIPANAKYMRLSVISGVSTYDPSIKFKFELGTVYTEWTASEEEVANAISSNSTAIQNTNAEVSRVDGRVTATNSNVDLLAGRIVTVENGLAVKADVTALNNIYTKAETDDKVTQITAGEIQAFKSSLSIGGENLLLGTDEKSRPNKHKGYGVIEYVIQPDVANVDAAYSTYHITFDGEYYVLSFDAKASIDGSQIRSYFYAPSNTISAETSQGYTSNGPDGNVYFTLSTEWVRYWVRWKQPLGVTSKQIIYARFHGQHGQAVTYQFARVKLETGTVATDYSLSGAEVNQALDANANAISETKAQVNNIEGTVSTHTSSLEHLSSNLSNVSNTASQALVSASDALSLAQTTSNALSTETSRVDALTSRYAKLPKRNLVLGTNEVKQGFFWLNFGRLAERIQGEITISFDCEKVDPNEADAGAGVGFNYGSGSDGGFSYVYYPVFGSGHFSQTLTVDSQSFTHFAIYSNNNVRIHNVMVTYGNTDEKWSIAPEELASKSDISVIYQTKADANSSSAAITSEVRSSLNASLYDNLIVNSDFSSGKLGWVSPPGYIDGMVDGVLNDNSGLGVNYNVREGDSNTYYMHTGGTSQGYTETYQDVSAKGSTQYQLSAYTAAHRTTSIIFAYFLNANNELVGNTTIAEPNQQNNQETWGGTSLENYKRCYINFTTPSDCKTIRVVLRKTTGQDAYVFATRFQLTEFIIPPNGPIAWSNGRAGGNTVVREQVRAINGIEAIKTVTIDNNGVMSGYGLISELKNGQVTSAFGVYADTFFIGAPSGGKKPFIQRNEWSQINGVWVPPGTYIDTAYIGAATISLANINTASITSLSALSANLGAFESTGADGSKTVISGSKTEVFYPNGQIAVRMGYW